MCSTEFEATSCSHLPCISVTMSNVYTEHKGMSDLLLCKISILVIMNKKIWTKEALLDFNIRKISDGLSMLLTH